MNLDPAALILCQVQRARDRRWQIRKPLLPRLHYFCGLRDRLAPRDLESSNHADRAGPKVEVGDDGEASVAATAQRPKQVWIFLPAHVANLARRIDHFHRQDAVACKSKGTPKQSETASKRVACDPNRKASSRWNRKIGPQGLIHRTKRGARADRHRLLVGRKLDPSHAANVDHQIRALRKSFIGMTARADREPQPVVGGPKHCVAAGFGASGYHTHAWRNLSSLVERLVILAEVI